MIKGRPLCVERVNIIDCHLHDVAHTLEIISMVRLTQDGKFAIIGQGWCPRSQDPCLFLSNWLATLPLQQASKETICLLDPSGWPQPLVLFDEPLDEEERCLSDKLAAFCRTYATQHGGTFVHTAAAEQLCNQIYNHGERAKGSTQLQAGVATL